MIIRNAGASDARALRELMALLGHELDDESIARRLTPGLLPTLVAVEHDRLVGMCVLASNIHIHREAPVGRITILVVAEQARGRGIGSALLDEAEQRLGDGGCGLIEVTSNFRFESGHAFYEARGFARTSFRFAKPLTPR